VNAAKLATILGVSRASVSRCIERGRLQKSVIKGTLGRFEIDLVGAIFEWYQNVDLSKDRGQHKSLETPSTTQKDEIPEFQESRKIKEHYSALLEKLTFERESGQVLDFDTTQKDVFDGFRVVRDQIQAIPDKVSGFLAAKTDVTDIRRYLLDEIDKTLDEVATVVHSILD
jgi:hypothetical protein